jgi:hypothetical protein
MIPAVHIPNPRHLEWRLLGLFGVVPIADVNYYLRCLVTLAGRERVDIDHIAYIYDKIQSYYRGNEPIFQYVSICADCIEDAKLMLVPFSLRET